MIVEKKVRYGMVEDFYLMEVLLSWIVSENINFEDYVFKVDVFICMFGCLVEYIK